MEEKVENVNLALEKWNALFIALITGNDSKGGVKQRL